MHWHHNIKILSIIYFCSAYFAYAVNKRCTVFKNYFFIVSISCNCCINCSLSNNSYSSFYKYNASLQSLKLEHSIVVLNLRFFLPHVPGLSSFISTWFLVLNLDGWVVWLSVKLLFFGIPFYSYTILILIHQ